MKTLVIAVGMAVFAIAILMLYPKKAESFNSSCKKPELIYCYDGLGNVVGWGNDCVCGGGVCVPNPCRSGTHPRKPEA